jgi:hypothetical protein
VLGTYVLEVDWNGNGVFNAGTEDISSFVIDLQWTRGRDFASQLDGRSVSGKLTAQLLNTDGRFSPANVATATNPITSASGSLLPGRQVRLQADSGDFDYEFPIIFATPLWQGFLREITPFPKVKGRSISALVAVGPLAHLNEKTVRFAYTSAPVPLGTAVDNILDAAGWDATARDIKDADIQTTLTNFYLPSQGILPALRDMEDTESGFLRETPTGGIGFDGRNTRLTNSRSTTAQASFTDEPTTGTLAFHVVVGNAPSQQVFNDIHGTYHPIATAATSTLWVSPETGTDSPAIAVGQTLTYLITYPNPNSIAEAFGVANWITPTATTDWKITTDQAGTGTNLNGNVKQTTEKFFDTMKVELEMTSGVDGFLPFLQARGVPVNKAQPVHVQKQDSVSQTAYGNRTYLSRSMHIPDSATMRSWIDFTLSSYKDPSNVLSISIPANKDLAHFEQAVSRDLGDRVSVSATGSSGLAVNEDFFVESMSHHVNSRRVHTASWKLSPVTALSGFWVLGVSKLGTSTKLSY